MSEISRRDFIKQASILSACACCFGTITLLDSCSTSANMSSASEKPIIETPTQVTVLKTAFNNQPYIKLSTGKFNDPIFVNTNADGSYTAVLMNCTHKGCSLGASQGKFVCPCHGSEFDLSGHVLSGPAKTDLKSFPVTSDDQHVFVHYQ